MMAKQPRTILDESGLELSLEDLEGFIAQAQNEQGSEGWFEDRLGNVTASNVKKVVARGRWDKPYSEYYSYMIQLAIERIIGAQKRFSNKYTDHGKLFEDEAAAMYQEYYPERDIREIGYVPHGEIAAGASPDRLVDDDGLIEIKAPNTDTLIKYMVSMIPEKINGEKNPDHELVGLLGLKGDEWKFYLDQMQMQMWITDRKWCDFVVYDPDLPENAQLVIKRVERDDEYIDGTMVPRILEFLDGVAKLERYLRNYQVGVTS